MNDQIQRYKARLVARGFKTTSGVNYLETFTRFDSVRIILSVAASKNLHLRQFDVKTAFLYEDLEENIFMEQPLGFEDGNPKVCKLNRSHYGLKQASRCWNQRLTSVLDRLGLKSTNADPCVFTNGNSADLLILAIYVDDGIIASLEERNRRETIRGTEKEIQRDVRTSEYVPGDPNRRI